MESQGTTVGDLSRVEIDSLSNLQPGHVAPVARGTSLAGEPMELAACRGQVVLLSFWASWCGPCMAAVPQEREMARRFVGRPFRLIGVNGDDDFEKAKKAVQEKGITWPSFRNGGVRGRLSDQWHVNAWPTLYLVDHRGMIRRRFVGFPDEKGLGELVEVQVAECEGDGTGKRE